MNSCRLISLLVLLGLSSGLKAQNPPVPEEVPAEVKLLQPGVKLTMLAEHPELMTPTGIDVDDAGNIWVVACHTHFRPEGYPGPEQDEVLIFDADGGNRRLFYDQTEATMDLELGAGGWVYLAERDRVLRIRDSDGDGVADVEETLADLETTSEYPHNGMSGLAWHPSGDLIFALGENFFKPWTLTGTDGREVEGTGEGGIFRCAPDGTELRRIAWGFWNPFGICVREDGEIFAAENDPGSRPPCRLLHVVEGGDYGYQRAYGNAPTHPFVAWNGELKGTLPMLHATGEAPCGIQPLGGGLIVPSWSDNRIDYFPLRPNGASYETDRVELASGSYNFRPTCIAPGLKPGEYYLTDWVFTSYELHQKGRLWKLEIDLEAASWMESMEPLPLPEEARLAAQLREGSVEMSEDRLFALANGEDAFLAQGALMDLVRRAPDWTMDHVRALPEINRGMAVLALRRSEVEARPWMELALEDPATSVRFEAIRWISDAGETSFQDRIRELMTDPALDFRLFEACLAAENTLSGNARAGILDRKMLLSWIRNAEAPARVRAWSLRLFPAELGQLTMPLLRDLYAVGDPELSMEVVRSLSEKGNEFARTMLEQIVNDDSAVEALRVEATLGLASAPQEHLETLLKLAAHDSEPLAEEALRALRGMPLEDSAKAELNAIVGTYPNREILVRAVLEPSTLLTGIPAFTDTEGWLARADAVTGEADPEVGRRLFFHPRLTRCVTCHRHSGRGKVVGPDLSLVADRDDRHWLMQSILDPSREVAPQFYSWNLEFRDGNTFTGIVLRKGGRSGKEFYRDITGAEQGFPKEDIVHREEMRSSLMPAGLTLNLTPSELRDLMAFLMGSE